jgi:large subunit ribosomal protein L11
LNFKCDDMAEETIDLLVEGGKAAPGPATAPKLGAYKLNIGDVFKKVNEATSAYKGMQVPVKIIIDKDTKEVKVEVGTPPVSSLIKKELGLEKAKTKAAEEAEKAAEAAKLSSATKAAGGAAGAASAAAPAEAEKVEEKAAEAPAEGEDAAAEGEAADATATPGEPVEKPKEVLASLKMEQVVKIAKMKMTALLAKDLKAAAKMVIGTANSMMGIQVEGKWPKDVIKEVDEGKWDDAIK